MAQQRKASITLTDTGAAGFDMRAEYHDGDIMGFAPDSLAHNAIQMLIGKLNEAAGPQGPAVHWRTDGTMWLEHMPSAPDGESAHEVETVTYADGTQVTGTPPLPALSPGEQALLVAAVGPGPYAQGDMESFQQLSPAERACAYGGMPDSAVAKG
jgi:hypothetical protein